METPFYKKYWKGLVYGFLFGIVGLWILSVLSLISQLFEVISWPLLAPGKWFSSVLVTGDSASDGIVAVLFLFNGILYALVGFFIQWLIARAKNNRR